MNRQNVLQFNLNAYKKHLSPFGRNVLDTLIKHWRTGFDNNESRRRQQFLSNQNRRNTREFCGNSCTIPSVPSSPPGEAQGDQITNFDSHNCPIPEVQTHQGSYPSTTSVDRDRADCDKYVHHAPFNNDNFAMPRLPVGRPSEPSTSIRTCHKKVLPQANHAAGDEIHHFTNVLPAVPMKQMLHDYTHGEFRTESVLTSGDLARSAVDITNTNEEEVLTANDIITPVIDFDNINKNLLSSTKKQSNEIGDSIPNMQAKTFLQILNTETNVEKYPSSDELITHKEEGVKKNVDWDDMFDTELFPGLTDPLQLMQPVENDRVNNFRMEFPRDRKRKQNKNGNIVSKPKTQSKNNNSVPKKMKKVTCVASESENIPEINLRKVKYTKAVKNWLDGVDSKNLVEHEIDVAFNGSNIIKTIIPIMQGTSIEESYLEDKRNAINKNEALEFNTKSRDNTTKKAAKSQMHQVNDEGELVSNGDEERNESKTTMHSAALIVKASPAIVIEKKSKAKNKKTIQTRLAKKDGKMKFGPPAKEQHESSKELPEDKESKNKETIEKVKTKLVPPIKSQIPVKNVTFDVNTIDEGNVHLIDDMINSENNLRDIALVVVYSNGFCELNNHHTEEICVPEGIMIQLSEKFFFLRDDEQNSFRDLMRQILKKSHIICYNGKRLLINLISKHDVELQQDVHNLRDAQIGASLIDPDNPPENFAELQKLLGITPEFTIATECALQKAAWYTTLLTECFDKLRSMLIDSSVWNVFVEIEMPLLPVIAGMEYQGVHVDLEKIKTMEEILLTKMKAVEQECYKAAGKTFQINSALQVRTILYDELQLDTKSNLKIKETIGKGAKSTSETMLRELVSVHPLPRLILEYRHLHKAHATFLTGIAQHVKDGTVKPTWVQMAAATGRMASNNPNLQAIPKAPFSLVVFPGESDEQEPPLNFRSVYTARPQHSFLAADFKHIECRVFAHAADDATLQDALRSGQDLFRVLAAKWLGKSVEAVSSEDRERTKRIVYASLYGAGARKLMEILHIGYEQALSVMSSFNRTFPALKSFGRAVVARAARGELRSLCGRARRFPHIASADAGLRAQAERQAVNFVVQGSAADLCKKAMVCVQRGLGPPALRCRLVLQIHDELVWEVADGHVDAAAAIIKVAMENVGRECGMDMTLPVELTHGRNWGEMQPFQNPNF